MSRGSSPTSSGANSSLIIAVSAWLAAMLPTWDLASPHPLKPHSVPMRTNVASNEVVRPKSLVCCFSDGIGMCTQYASTDRIFMAEILLPWSGLPPGSLAGLWLMGHDQIALPCSKNSFPSRLHHQFQPSLRAQRGAPRNDS